jgi:rhamnosyltransferase subunit B
MSRVVLACWGSYGDLFPSLAIAARLKALGHTPVIASCAAYDRLVKDEGFEFRPLRPDVSPDDTPLIQRIMEPKRGSEIIIRELISPAVRNSYEDLVVAAEGADLIVSHPITFAAPLVAEKMKLPWVSTVLAPLSLFSAYDFPVLPNMPQVIALRHLGPWTGRLLIKIARRITAPWVTPVHQLRAKLGLPRGADPLYEGQFSPHGNLALFSRLLGDVQRDWPAKSRVTGFLFSNRAIPMPAELAAFLDAGEPPVVFTLGTSAVSAAGTFYDESARAIAELKCRAVLLVGRHPKNIPRHLPPNVIAVDSAPHDQLFPRAAVVVHQGGVGTTGQAMRAGRPELVVPHAHDQPDNAYRVKNLGIARVLYPKRYTATRVVADLRTLMTDTRYAERAGMVARQVRAETGAESAVAAMLAVI